MAGHEKSVVRPHTAQQTLRIAAGSPLAIQGIFLEILRERFKEDGGLDWVWREDISSTDIEIEASYNENTESRNQTPAIFVTRLRSAPTKVAIGDRAGVHLPDHRELYKAIMDVLIHIECVSADQGESSILGDLVQFTLLAAQDVIQREFGFHNIEHPVLGQTTPYDRDTEKWVTPVDFSVQFFIHWSQVPIGPLLQQIAQRVTNHPQSNASYFVDTIVNSYRRGETE